MPTHAPHRPVKISSPVGEYEYRVEGVRLRDGRLEVLGRLGQWETTTIFEHSDLRKLVRKTLVPLILVIGLATVTRRQKRV